MENRLAIVVGHNEAHPGVLASFPINEYEFFFNRKVARSIYQFARTIGLNCEIFERKVMTTFTSEVEEVYKRVNTWCEESNAVCIELHFNAFDGKQVGTLTLFDEDPGDSLDFAREIHIGTVGLYKRKNKEDRKCMLAGDKYGRGVQNLKAMKVTGCIAEPFFGDNSVDAGLCYPLTFDYARMIAETSLRFLNNRKLGK